jgi:coenzyme PQQ biosynthesis protein PqqD
MNSGAVIQRESRPALAPQVRFRNDPVSGEPVLLYPEGVLVLNATAADIVKRCDGKTSIAQIVAQMGREYETDEATLNEDLMECLIDLSKRTLLVFLP